MIDRITIDRVMELANIYDIVSDFIELKKAGTVYKACCPFHGEKTPSFVVSPSKNIFKCFGCGKGGNAVDFIMEHEGMSYPEAIKWLCAKYHIECKEEDRKRSQQEIEQQRKRESLFIITKAAAEFYASQIHEDDAECKAALDYVNQRWNRRDFSQKKKAKDDIEKDYPQLMGIGYAKGWDSFYQYGKKKGFAELLMEEAGVIKKSSKGNYIDAFHHRIVIPIRDRYRNVTGFTCRTMKSEDENIPKYLNSSDSDIYHKGASIFGIDTAVKRAVQEQRFYLVEGAPDVMQLQSIGVDNTIATLGTAWTKEHFLQLKKYNATLCFIPDQDIPKRNERYGAGINAVMKNGKEAIKEGFRVTVVEIPASAKKQDADSYFTERRLLDELPEEDFVIWYTKKLFETTDNTTERAGKIKDVCGIIANISEEYTQDSLIERLGNMHNGKNAWTRALREVKREIDHKRAAAISKKGDIDLLMKYGFMEQNRCYYGENGKKQWSNFTMKPLFHIKDVSNAKRIYKVRNIYGRTELIELKTEELISLPKFQQRLESLGNFLWMVSMDELRRLKEYLYENTETAEEIKQLGWNKAGFFAWGNGIYIDGHFNKVDDFGIVRLERADDKGQAYQDNYYMPAMSKIYADERELFIFERQFTFNDSHSAISLPDFSLMMADVFGDNAKVGITFLLATLFRDIIFSYNRNFPLLNLFGPKGSGKSELAHTLMGFFIKDDSGINIQNATVSALADAVAQRSNALVHIDEYKNNLDTIKMEFLKGSYDGAGRSRMNMELDKKRQTTRVDSGIILSGQEMPTADIALFSRTIYLTFGSAVHTKEEKRRFNELSVIRAMGVPHLTNQVLSHRKLISDYFYETYNETLTDTEKYNPEGVEDRIWRNWSMLLAIYKILQKPLSLPWSYEEMRAITVEGINRQNQECSANNEMGSFWDMIEFMKSEGMIYKECDYKIKMLDSIKTKETERQFPCPTPVLMIRLGHILPQYKKVAKLTDERAMNRNSIKYYLTHMPEYLGVKAGSERFKMIINGVQQQQKTDDGKGNVCYRDINQCDNPLCFDYSKMKERYGLNLESAEEYAEMQKPKDQKLPYGSA